MTDEEHRVMYVNVSRQAFSWVFTEGVYKVVNGVPEDSEVVGIEFKAEKDMFKVVLKSEEFDKVPEGGQVPQHEAIDVKSLEHVN